MGGGDSDEDFLMRLLVWVLLESSEALRFEAERSVRSFAPREVEGEGNLLSVFVADGAIIAVFYIIYMCSSCGVA